MIYTQRDIISAADRALAAVRELKKLALTGQFTEGENDAAPGADEALPMLVLLLHYDGKVIEPAVKVALDNVVRGLQSNPHAGKSAAAIREANLAIDEFDGMTFVNDRGLDKAVSNVTRKVEAAYAIIPSRAEAASLLALILRYDSESIDDERVAPVLSSILNNLLTSTQTVDA